MNNKSQKIIFLLLVFLNLVISTSTQEIISHIALSDSDNELVSRDSAAGDGNSGGGGGGSGGSSGGVTNVNCTIYNNGSGGSSGNHYECTPPPPPPPPSSCNFSFDIRKDSCHIVFGSGDSIVDTISFYLVILHLLVLVYDIAI
ncbi:hypothetical protein RclHR1_08100006 [Rhizophagus clarus]|uniref:Uncharacterized protein n=1 Tax=Rhizophagus clarus TaxID=94130 RepID=A0A2Z6RZD3_9GLOM|nr:hypothetical protein RclHR1_08100006 [Rhizophagus clarus]GET02994.1 hypothetical protein RCL_jg8193.t1 [Rhizophagus clarus]